MKKIFFCYYKIYVPACIKASHPGTLQSCTDPIEVVYARYGKNGFATPGYWLEMQNFYHEGWTPAYHPEQGCCSWELPTGW